MSEAKAREGRHAAGQDDSLRFGRKTWRHEGYERFGSCIVVSRKINGLVTVNTSLCCDGAYSCLLPSGCHLQLLAVLLHRELLVALEAKPVCLLPPMLSVGKGPPEDVHELGLAFAPTLYPSLRDLVAMGTLHTLRPGLQLREGNDNFVCRLPGFYAIRAAVDVAVGCAVVIAMGFAKGFAVVDAAVGVSRILLGH